MAKKEVRPFCMRDKMGYLFGDFGNDFTFILSSSFLLKFYTDIMGVNAAVVGLVMMIARFVDAFTDVAMGRICDRSKVGKNGKFRPWIRRMAGPVAIASFLIYQIPVSNRHEHMFCYFFLSQSLLLLLPAEWCQSHYLHA